MLTIWGRKTSSNVQALMWCVGELNLPHIRHDAGHRYGGLDTPEFGRLNPNRTIPVLQDGSNPPIWETGAILRYLVARYGKDSFWPDRLLFFQGEAPGGEAEHRPVVRLRGRDFDRLGSGSRSV